MKCGKCGTSVMKRPLQRVNEKGVAGIWWCEVCLKLHEPELYANTMEDQTPVEKTLKEIFYSQHKDIN